jgi:hypothetical protein
VKEENQDIEMGRRERKQMEEEMSSLLNISIYLYEGAYLC